MANTRARLFVLLGALFAFLSYFLDFESPFFRSHILWLPVGIDLSTLSNTLGTTSSFLTRPDTSSVAHTHLLYLVSGSVFYLAYWSLLLLILVQMGLALWTLRSCSAHTRTWTRILVISSLILSALWFGGLLVSTADSSALWTGNVLQVSLWDVLHKTSDPGILLVAFLIGGRPLVLSTLGFVLILVFNHFTQPQASLPLPTPQGISRRAATLKLAGMVGLIFGLPSLAVGGYFWYRKLTDPDVSRYSGGYISAMAWAPAGQRIALIRNNTTMVIWEALSGEVLFTFQTGSANSSFPANVVWSRDSKQLITFQLSELKATAFQGLCIWDSQTGELLKQQPLVLPVNSDLSSRMVDSGSWALNSQRLAVVRDILNADGVAVSTFLQIQETVSGKLLYSSPSFPVEDNAFNNLVWAPDMLTLASYTPAGGSSRVLIILNSTNGQILHRYDLPQNDGIFVTPAWSPDGRWIVVSNSFGADIVDVASGNILAHHSDLFAGQGDLLAWSPDGQHLVLARNRGRGFGPISYQLAILTLADGRIVWQQEDDNHIQALAWSPNSQYLAFLDVRSIVHVRHIP